MQFWKRFAILSLAGCLHALSLAWPFTFEIKHLGLTAGQSVWGLQMAALAVLAGALLTINRNTNSKTNTNTLKQAAWQSWVFSTSWMCGTIWWLYISMHTYGGLPAGLAAFAVLLLSGCLALFYMLVCMAFMRLAGVNERLFALLFASCWMLAELARGTWLTGFPWGAAGYAHVQGPLAGLAPSVGVDGVRFVSAFAAMALAQWVIGMYQGEKVQRMHGLIVLPLLVVGAGLLSMMHGSAAPLSSAKPLDVTLLQGNIPQNEKFQAGTGVATALSWYAEQLQASTTSLIITPETAIPMLPQQLPPDYWVKIRQRFATGEQAALVGIPMGDQRNGYTNSVLGLKPPLPGNPAMTAPYQYDKDHLVPFGEFIPPFAQWFIQLMNIPLGTFNKGGLQQPTFNWQGQRLGLNICYEDLFTEELAQRFGNPATAPTILVNVSNIAWFGNTLAIDQHLNIARLRSMELARPSIRATNTGATVVIDANGQVTQSLERHTRGALVAQVQGNTTITPYAWWVSRFWLWPLWLLGLGVLILAWRMNGRSMK